MSTDQATNAAPQALGSTDGLGGASQTCRWEQEDFDSDVWNTDCGEAMCLNNGTPGDNFMRFCCYCGKPVDGVSAEHVPLDA